MTTTMSAASRRPGHRPRRARRIRPRRAGRDGGRAVVEACRGGRAHGRRARSGRGRRRRRAVRGLTELGGHPTIEHLPQLSGQRRHHVLLLTKTIQKAWGVQQRDHRKSRQVPASPRAATCARVPPRARIRLTSTAAEGNLPVPAKGPDARGSPASARTPSGTGRRPSPPGLTSAAARSPLVQEGSG